MGYFPSAAGDQWYYDKTTDDPGVPSPMSLLTVSVNGTKTVQGATATVFTKVDSSTPTVPIDDYFAFSGGGVTSLGNSDSGDTVSPLIVPYISLLFPVQVGTVSSLSGTNLVFGKDATGKSITLSLTQSIKNVGIEPVSVASGEFANAMKQITAITGTATDAATNQVFAVNGTDTEWLVPGVGVVKEASTATVSTKTINESSELRGYTVGGARHGLGTPYVVAAGLEPHGTAGGLMVSPAVVGFDGAHYVAIYQTLSGTAPNLQSSWNAAVFLMEGSVQLSTNLTGIVPLSTEPERAAVASDGSHFVLALQRNTQPAPPSPGPSVAVSLLSADGSIAPSFTTVTPLGASYPALAYDGTNYLLVYAQGAPMARQLFGLFISPKTGQPAGSAFPITSLGGVKESTTLAFDGANYLVVWRDDADMGAPGIPGLYGVRISQTGTILDAQPVPIALGPTSAVGVVTNPALAFDGANYLVVYMDSRTQSSGQGYNISAARVSTAGMLVDGTSSAQGFAITTSAGSFNTHPAVAFIGGQYWISWVSSSTADGAGDLVGARITTAGTLPGAATAGFRFAPPGSDRYPSMAGNASGGVLLWTADTAPSSANSLAAEAIYAAGL